MDEKPATGHRIHFESVVATSTPKRIVGGDGRQAVVFVNTGDVDIRLGHSGSIAAQGLILPADQGFTDNYTADEWWAYAPSGTGTVSGFIVV